MTVNHRANILWSHIADEIGIPFSLYERASNRHQALGAWFCRPGSALAQYKPSVRPQGSFRFGTVVKPLDPTAEFDLDNVVVLEELTRLHITQAELKALHGKELAGYASAHGMLNPEEHNRCWRLRYRDEPASFHLDSLPAVPADAGVVQGLLDTGMGSRFAEVAIAITDRRDPHYRDSNCPWPMSNPRGFARWFESRAALGRDQSAHKRILSAEIEDVPPYRWDTPLQRAIKILKRHRDVMFAAHQDIAPISMIITNLAAAAYQGERDLTEALRNILERMPQLVLARSPRVPNPTLPHEDYADKWKRDPRLEPAFWQWHEQATADVERLSSSLETITAAEIRRKFKVSISSELESRLNSVIPAALSASAALAIGNAPPPWGGSVG